MSRHVGGAVNKLLTWALFAWTMADIAVFAAIVLMTVLP
jgi:hypothetical protein